MMLDSARRLSSALDAAKSARKKGDALRGRRPEADVVSAYGVGADALQSAIASVAPDEARLERQGPPAGELEEFLLLLVESYGVLGGLLQRLNRLGDARACYAAGGGLEDRFALPSTYNRLNRVKQDLLIDSGLALQSLEPDLDRLARVITDALNADQSLSDSGWAWADLGDCLALLGRTAEAARAYATFVAKAEIKSPERTLDVLRQIASKLRERSDPGVVRLQSAIDVLETRLVRTA
jgi:tetratricopeptide (TPR) repeat protein